MKGFIILGLSASSILSAQTDSTQIKEIQEVSFTRRLPVSKEIINVQKDLGAKKSRSGFAYFAQKSNVCNFHIRRRKWRWIHRFQD